VHHPGDDLQANLVAGYRMLAGVWPPAG
jgi:hypothetical protein